MSIDRTKLATALEAERATHAQRTERSRAAFEAAESAPVPAATG